MNKTFALLLVVFAAMLIFAGCNSSTSPNPSPGTSPPAEGNDLAGDLSETGLLKLVWSQGIGTDSLFETPWSDLQSLYPDMVFDSLLNLNADESVVPKLASKVEVSDDLLTYKFTLDKSAKWHDGTPFTQDDVLFSFNTALQFSKFFGKQAFIDIEGAQDVVDGKSKTISGITAKDGVVTIKRTAPDNSFLANLRTFYILPSHLLKDADPITLDTYEAFWKHPIGTGAYKLNEIKFPYYFTVERNDDYFGAKAGIKNILFTSYDTGGNDALEAALIAGEVDLAYGNAVNDINVAKNISSQNSAVQMMILPNNYLRMIWYNTAGSMDNKYNKDMQKPAVRQALNILIDKEKIASFYNEQAVGLTTLVNPESPAYNADIPMFKRDVERGKKMLTDAGFDFSKNVRLLYYYTDQTTSDVMELVKQNLLEAGVKVDLILASGDLASIIYEQRNWDMIYAGGGNSDAILTYTFLVPSGSSYDKLFADTDIRNEMKNLIDQYKAGRDITEKKKVGDKVQVWGNQHAYALGIYSLNSIVLTNAAHLKLDDESYRVDNPYRYGHYENWRLIGK